jgi:hypothetical protein
MLVDLDHQELGLLVRVVSLTRHAEVILADCTDEEQGVLKQLAGKLDQARNKEMERDDRSAGVIAGSG